MKRMKTQHSASVFQMEDISYVIVLSVPRRWLVFAHYWPILKSPGSKFVFIQNEEQISRGEEKKINSHLLTFIHIGAVKSMQDCHSEDAQL